MRNKLQFQIIQGELSNLSQITLLQRNEKIKQLMVELEFQSQDIWRKLSVRA